MHGTCTCPFYWRDYPHKDEVLDLILYKIANFLLEKKFGMLSRMIFVLAGQSQFDWQAIWGR